MSSHVPNGPLRTAVVGTGSIARSSHLPALTKLAAEGEVEVVAAVDVDGPAVRAFADEFGIPQASTDLHAMLTETRPDLVVLCTPPPCTASRPWPRSPPGPGCGARSRPAPPWPTTTPSRAAEQGDGAGPYASVVFQHRFGSGARHVRAAAARRGAGPAAGGPLPDHLVPEPGVLRGALARPLGHRGRRIRPWDTESTRPTCCWT